MLRPRTLVSYIAPEWNTRQSVAQQKTVIYNLVVCLQVRGSSERPYLPQRFDVAVAMLLSKLLLSSTRVERCGRAAVVVSHTFRLNYNGEGGNNNMVEQACWECRETVTRDVFIQRADLPML